MDVLHHGAKSDAIRALQAATNRRLAARDLGGFRVKEDGVLGVSTLEAVRKAAWALGARSETYEAITRKREIPVGVQRMILNPGNRTDEQKAIGAARIAAMRKARGDREKAEAASSGSRKKFVDNALQAGRNYQARPGAYHYLAGGIANLIYLTPSPLNYRSDCSQFASSVQKDSGLPDLGPNGPLWVNTDVMDNHLQVTTSPKPGDFGMYGHHHGGTHHVECYLGSLGGPGHEFMGHGSPPIDSMTPGRPDFYLANPVGV